MRARQQGNSHTTDIAGHFKMATTSNADSEVLLEKSHLPSCKPWTTNMIASWNSSTSGAAEFQAHMIHAGAIIESLHVCFYVNCNCSFWPDR